VLQALVEALTNAPLQRPSAVVISVLMVVGIIVIFVRQRDLIWLVGSWLMAVMLFVFATAVEYGPLRTALVGAWYNNLPRLAALLAITALPFAVLGAAWILRLIGTAISGQRNNASQPTRMPLAHGTRGWTAIGVTVVLIFALIPITHGAPIATVRGVITTVYRFNASSPLLSPDERAMFDTVKKVTPRDAVVAGNPWNGSALVYAYANRRALFPHIRGNWTSDQLALAKGFASGTPAVCAAIHRLGVTYALDFGSNYLTPDNPRTKEYPGFGGLAKSRVLSLVAQDGTAKLYKVTGCPST